MTATGTWSRRADSKKKKKQIPGDNYKYFMWISRRNEEFEGNGNNYHIRTCIVTAILDITIRGATAENSTVSATPQYTPLTENSIFISRFRVGVYNILHSREKLTKLKNRPKTHDNTKRTNIAHELWSK